MRASVTLALLFVLVSVSAMPAAAEPYAYVLNGGVNSRQFWFYAGNVNSAYNDLARTAILNDWNVIGNGSRIYFTETTNYYDSEADWYALSYGNTEWAGVAVQRVTGGDGAVHCMGCVPYRNWDYTEISLNDDHLRDPVTFPTNKIKAVEGHEFGHAIGLDHEGDPIDHPCQLMNQFLLDDWRVGCAPSTTQTWDRYWARQLQ